MKHYTRKMGVMNGAILLLTLVLPALIWLYQGLPGAYAWFVLKLVLPFAGLAGLLYQTGALMLFTSRRKQPVKRAVSLIIYTLWASCLLLTVNVIPLAYPASLTDSRPSAIIAWPFAEEAVIGWGGDSVEDNLPHAIWPSERWAYDIVMEPYGTGSRNPEDYGVWNREVLSPAAGTVIAAYQDEADLTPGEENFQTMAGNHVYLRLDDSGTYLLLNHFKQGSITVQVGDYVKQGDLLGRVGNSGSSSEPHLHIHHQRQNPTKTLHPVLAEGLPLYFGNSTDTLMPKKGTALKQSND